MTDTDMLYIASLNKQLDSARAENGKLRELLCELQPILRRAFFANYNDTNAANELYDRIADIIGKEFQ